MTAPAFGATDILSLGADWEPQSSDGAKASTIARAGGADGDIIAEKQHNSIQSGTASYIYVGAETGFIGALASFWPGKLVASNTLQITNVAIDYSPCAQGQRPKVTFSFRDGPTADPATPFWYVTDLVLPTYTAANVIVPQSVLTATLGDAEITNVQWSLGCEVGQDNDKDGDYLASQAYQGNETIALTTKGIPTSITSTGWLIPSEAAALVPNTSNSDYPDHTYQFQRKVTRSIA